MSSREILKSDLAFDSLEDALQFRLTYEGPLYSQQQDVRSGHRDPRAVHKHELRKHFHNQLKKLWSVNPYLAHGEPATFDWQQSGSPKGAVTYGSKLSDWVASQYERNGYNFVPLVRHDLSLLCSLDILFMRREAPGSVIESGDIDNRIKPLFDGLRMIRSEGELGGYDAPDEGEKPFYTLLEDDSLITKLSVETDVLLEPVNGKFDMADVRLIISVDIRPYNSNPANIFYA